MVYKLYGLTQEEIKTVEGENENSDWADENPGQFCAFQRNPRKDIFDTNVLQYLQDFGEYIFKHYRKSEEYFQEPKDKIKKGNWGLVWPSGMFKRLFGNQ